MGSREPAGRHRVTVFYPLRGGVLITDELLQVGRRRYEVAALANLQEVPLRGHGVWRRSAPWQLLADYRGETVVLYESTDPTEFHQVCRALLRATEHHAERPSA